MMDFLESLETLVLKELLVSPVKLESLALLGRLVIKALLVPEDHKEKMGHQVLDFVLLRFVTHLKEDKRCLLRKMMIDNIFSL